jgi:hypothetical protein
MEQQLRMGTGARGYFVLCLLGSFFGCICETHTQEAPRRRHYHWIELRRVLLVTRSFASPFSFSLLLSLNNGASSTTTPPCVGCDDEAKSGKTKILLKTFSSPYFLFCFYYLLFFFAETPAELR